MPKRIAVIDIGSNSARLVIYQRTSRYGFHLIVQQKSRVRIGEGAYERGGELQEVVCAGPSALCNLFDTLSKNTKSIKSTASRPPHCVTPPIEATSSQKSDKNWI